MEDAKLPVGSNVFIIYFVKSANCALNSSSSFPPLRFKIVCTNQVYEFTLICVRLQCESAI